MFDDCFIRYIVTLNRYGTGGSVHKSELYFADIGAESKIGFSAESEIRPMHDCIQNRYFWMHFRACYACYVNDTKKRTHVSS